MKKVLYLTNIPVPYRVRFLNQLAEHCDLTVLYERENSQNRDACWASGEEKQFRTKYLRGIRLGNENAFSLGILKALFRDYDHIIVGCCNSPVQLLAMLVMRLFRIRYILNLDGEPFLSRKGIKTAVKRFFLSGADRYLAAGEKAACSLRPLAGDKPVIPYYFSSLSDGELEVHRNSALQFQRGNTILVVGQYFDYKGLDVALEAARLDRTLNFKFVGMGSRTGLFLKDQEIPDNVEIVPFLQKQALNREYQSCAMLVLPSRQECWGLVIHEAASFGTPIVSTWGSGAAVEFLGDRYPAYLARPGDAEDLLCCIRRCLTAAEQEAYSSFLLEKSRDYSIERSVRAHLTALD